MLSSCGSWWQAGAEVRWEKVWKNGGVDWWMKSFFLFGLHHGCKISNQAGGLADR